jgi:predicted small secreted protein
MKRIIALLLLLVLLLAGCTKTAEEAYLDIYDEYTAKLQETTPQLIAEFRAAAGEETDIIRLSELSTKKTEELALISTEGMQKMAEIPAEYNGDYAAYDEWAAKLMQVYTDEAAKIEAVYMELAGGGQ